ncbi:unnamed protein product [Heterobilharzia americana]|nr:unnamed protein product [Heterobilharzia americana]
MIIVHVIFHFYLLVYLVLSYASDNQSSFSCPVGSFYSCKAKQTIVLSSSDPSPLSAKLTVSQLKVEAFRNGLKPEFNGISKSTSVLYNFVAACSKFCYTKFPTSEWLRTEFMNR